MLGKFATMCPEWSLIGLDHIFRLVTSRMLFIDNLYNVSEDNWTDSDQDIEKVFERSAAANLAPQGAGTGYLEQVAQYLPLSRPRLPVSKTSQKERRCP